MDQKSGSEIHEHINQNTSTKNLILMSYESGVQNAFKQ